MYRTAIFITEPQRDALAALSKITGAPAAEHIRRAIDAYLADPKQVEMFDLQNREAARRAAGVPFPTFDDVESTILVKFLPEEDQARIAAAPNDAAKRALLKEIFERADAAPKAAG